ncbi:unnamed protein product [Nyctereutes procyonoides]|uniref:(raccoon dog) hypothetical protein n=1 Tax=Nyctereutes procyonoides TaxID=34880 RepID=A0A811YDI8_NYCPR|nr:unnamed protein product [Nyctereutes procyonoides]
MVLSLPLIIILTVKHSLSTIFLQHAYDGLNFIILNKDLFFWMATDNMARITKWAQEANWHEITTPFCRIRGFYPPGICMIWLKNGEEIVQEIGKGDILPKGDGSYWTWGSVELDPQSGDLYSCPCRLWPLRSTAGGAGVGVLAWGRRPQLGGRWRQNGVINLFTPDP